MDGYSRGTKLSSSLEIRLSNVFNDEEGRKDVLKIDTKRRKKRI